ncbi:MAG: glycosyltransferase family 4 protein [Thermoplasmata archaeon]|nr:MAG: glycosyltransferase family 4 protein [Thermoplasmata archaeon]
MNIVRVAMISSVYHPCYHAPGMCRFVTELSKYLVNLGINLDVITINWHKFSEREKFNGVNIYRVPAPRLPSIFPIIFQGINARHLLKKEKYDVIHVQGGEGWFVIPLRKKKKFVMVTTALGTAKGEMKAIKSVGLKNFLFKYVHWNILHAFDKHTMRHSDRIVAISNKTKSEVVRQMGVSGSQIDVIYPGVDGKKFRSQPNSHNKNSDCLHLLYIGPLIQRKGLKYLIQALPLCDIKTHLTIIGRGIEEASLRSLAGRLGVEREITWITNRISEEDLIWHYNNADVFVLPTLYEGFGIPLIESMACSTPVISTNIPPINEIVVNDKTGILLPLQNTNEIARAITKLSDSDLRCRMGNKARKHIEKNFSWEISAKKLLGIYEEMVGV